MTINELLTLIKTHSGNINFDDVIRVIDSNYQYTTTRFSNGKGTDTITNEPGTNEGSCKIFAFAKRQQLTKQQTLACFGKYYREDVLQNPDGDNHANIRTLMSYSLEDINFDNPVLIEK